MRFYLGTHKPAWLWDLAANFPLFVSHRALAEYRTLRPATHSWALDSGTHQSAEEHQRRTVANYAACHRQLC